MRYAALFSVEPGFKLASSEEGFANVTEEECARMCVQSKHCNCKSFAHNAQKGRCLIANRFSGLSPYDALLERREVFSSHVSHLNLCFSVAICRNC